METPESETAEEAAGGRGPNDADRPRRSSTGRLHSPTRETLLRILEAEAAPVSTATLAKATGWHENTVRGHVQALWHDGYLARSRAHGDPGRPAWLWSAKDRPAGAPYATLSRVLAEALAHGGQDPVREARESGRAWGRTIGAGLPRAASPAEARLAVIDTMREQGFAPRRVGDAGTGGEAQAAEQGGARAGRGAERRTGRGDGTIALGQCPFIEAASAQPSIVCAVHLGMIAGVLEAVGAEDGGSELVPFSAPGECTLRLRVSA